MKKTKKLSKIKRAKLTRTQFEEFAALDRVSVMLHIHTKALDECEAINKDKVLYRKYQRVCEELGEIYQMLGARFFATTEKLEDDREV